MVVFNYLPPSPDFFVHIKFILVSAFEQTLFIIHYQRPISRLSAIWRTLQVLVFKFNDVLPPLAAENNWLQALAKSKLRCLGISR